MSEMAERILERRRQRANEKIEKIDDISKLSPLAQRILARRKERGITKPTEEPSFLDIAVPAFLHGATVGAYTPENYKQLVKEHPWITGISDFAGATVPIAALSIIASPIVGLGARTAFGARALTTGGRLARAGATGAVIGAPYGAAEKYFEGGTPGEIVKAGLKTGAIFGALEPAVVGTGMVIKGWRGAKVSKEIGNDLKAKVDEIRGNIIEQFKIAYRNGDQATMERLRAELDKYPTFDAGAIPTGEAIPMPAPGVSLRTDIVKWKPQEALGESKPKTVETEAGTKLLETKSNITEAQREFKNRSSKAFFALYDTETKQLSDAVTDETIKATGKNIKVMVDNGKVKIIEIGKGVTKADERKTIIEAIGETRNKFLKTELYKEMSPEEEFLSLDIDGGVEAAIKDVAEEVIHPSGKVVTMSGLKKLAETKGLKYEQLIRNDGGFEFKILTKDGRTEAIFQDMYSVDKFLNEYKIGTKIEKLENKIGLKSIERAPELVSDKYKFESPRVIKSYKRILEYERMYQGESLPDFVSIINVLGKSGAYSARRDINLLQKFQPMKNALQAAERKSYIPVYNEGYLPMEKAMQEEGDWLFPQMKIIRESFRGIKRARRENIVGKVLETKGVIRLNRNYSETMKLINADPTLKEMFGSMTENEFRAAKFSREKYDEFFSFFDVEAERYLEDYLPRMRKMGTDFTEKLINEFNMPKGYYVFFKHQRTGGYFPREKDPLRLLSAYARIGANEKFLEPSYQKFVKMLEAYKKEGMLLPGVEALAKKYLGEVRSFKTGSGYALDQTIRDVATFFSKMLKKAGMKEWEKEDIERIVSKLVSYELNLTYAGAMGFRPYTCIRNVFQTLLTTLPKLGPKYTLLGIKDALTKEAWNEARAAGHLVERYSPVPFGEEVVGGAIEKTAKASLWAYRKADSFNRVVAYRGAKRMIENYTKLLEKDLKGLIRKRDQKLIDKRLKKFNRQVEWDWVDPVVMTGEFKPLLETGRFKELGERFARHMVEDTQWIYRRANAPYWMRGNVGKLCGQFGIWPTYFAQYGRSLTRGDPINVAKRLSRFAAISSLTAFVGANVFGVDIKKWVWYHPLMWGGPPSVGAINALRKSIPGVSSEYEQAVAENTLKSYAKIHIPSYLAARGIVQAIEETDEEDRLKKLLGFKPVED